MRNEWKNGTLFYLNGLIHGEPKRRIPVYEILENWPPKEVLFRKPDSYESIPNPLLTPAEFTPRAKIEEEYTFQGWVLEKAGTKPEILEFINHLQVDSLTAHALQISYAHAALLRDCTTLHGFANEPPSVNAIHTPEWNSYAPVSKDALKLLLEEPWKFISLSESQSALFAPNGEFARGFAEVVDDLSCDAWEAIGSLVTKSDGIVLKQLNKSLSKLTLPITRKTQLVERAFMAASDISYANAKGFNLAFYNSRTHTRDVVMGAVHEILNAKYLSHEGWQFGYLGFFKDSVGKPLDEWIQEYVLKPSGYIGQTQRLEM
jgi:hypothetical protein